jgi:hypothetical protein
VYCFEQADQPDGASVEELVLSPGDPGGSGSGGPGPAGRSAAGPGPAGRSPAGRSAAGRSAAGRSAAGRSAAGRSSGGQSSADLSPAGRSSGGQSSADLSPAGRSSDVLSEREAVLPGVGPTVVVEAAAILLPPASRNGLPYSALPDEGDVGRLVAAVAIPYFQWDNRDGQAMRVWMPLSRPGEPATRDHPAASRAPLSTEEA